MREKPIGIPGSKGRLTKGNTYKHRYVDEICPECGNDNAYIDRWHTRLKFTCMKRECRHEFYKKRWEEQPDGSRRDTYPDYVGQEGMTIEDAMRDLAGTHNQPERSRY